MGRMDGRPDGRRMMMMMMMGGRVTMAVLNVKRASAEREDRKEKKKKEKKNPKLQKKIPLFPLAVSVPTAIPHDAAPLAIPVAVDAASTTAHAAAAVHAVVVRVVVGDDRPARDLADLLDASSARVHQRAQLAVALLGELEGRVARAEGVVALALHAQGALEGTVTLLLEALHAVVGGEAYVVLLERGLEIGEERGDGGGTAGDGHRLLRGLGRGGRSGGGLA